MLLKLILDHFCMFCIYVGYFIAGFHHEKDTIVSDSVIQLNLCDFMVVGKGYSDLQLLSNTLP